MSQKSLDKLIENLKSEAIGAADREANKILEEARAKARNRIEAAETRSKELLEQAETESRAVLQKGEAALQQAARDVSVSARNELLGLLRTVLEQEVAATFSPDLIEKAVLKIMENVGSDASVELPADMEASLAKQIHKRLQASADIASMTTDSSLHQGFSISKQDEGWRYDISPEAVSDVLYAHLSPQWVALLNNASPE